MADRYTYVPLIGLFIMVAWCIPSATVEHPSGRRIVAASAALLLGVCALLSNRQVRFWQDSVTLCERALAVTKDNEVAQFNLGVALAKTSNIEEALGHFEQALRIQPRNADARYSMGVLLSRAGRIPEAIWQYEQTLRIKSDYVEAQNNLAWLLATLAPAEGGDPVRAVTLAERACELTGKRGATYLDTLASAYAAAGRFNEAINTADEAIELARNNGQSQLVEEIKARLQMYRRGQPYRTSHR